MAGNGKAPKPPARRRGRHAPQRGEYSTSLLVGWQHGEVPDPPEGIGELARQTWSTWMGSWFAAYWDPSDLPGLRIVIGLYDLIASGKVTAAERSELRQWMDNYGITKKGQQDRRWVKPAGTPDAPAAATRAPRSPYSHLRVVDARTA